MRAHVPRSKNIALSNGKNTIALRFVVYGLLKTFGIAYVQSVKKKGGDTPINSYTNYHREMELVPINMDYCLLQFDEWKFCLGVSVHGSSLPDFDFFNVNPQL